MELKKVNSISELWEIQESIRVTLDGVVHDIKKEYSLLYVSNGDGSKILRCESFGAALLGKNFEPGDLINVIGTYYPKSRVLSLEKCGYQTLTKASELPQ